MIRLRALLTIAALATTVSCTRDLSQLNQKYIQTGDKYFAAGKYRQASIFYQSTIRRNARFAEGYYRWALAELKLDETAKAVPPLRRAIELLPDGPERCDAKSKLADIHLYYLEGIVKDKNLYAETQQLVDELFACGPSGEYDGHRLKGRMEMLEVRYAIRRAAPEPQVKAHLAASVEELRAAAAIRPFQTDVLVPLARTLISGGRTEEAEKIYLDLLEHDKTFVPGYSELYNIYVRGGRQNEAEAILKRGMANNPKELLFITNLAWHYHGIHREEEALQTIERLKTVGQGTPHLHSTVGSFYMKWGNSAEAIRQFEAGMEAEPKEKNYYRKRIAETLMASGKYTDAGRAIESVLKDDPKDTEARLLQGSNFLHEGDLDKAAVALQGAVTADLGNPVARYMLGSALMEQGQLALALPELQKATQLDPKDIGSRLKLAQLQILLEQNEGAIKTTENIFEDLDARSVPAMLLHAVALRNLGRADQAGAQLQTVLKLQPNSPDALLQVGELRLSAKNYRQAEELFRKSYEQNPADTRGLLRIAEMYIAKNESAQAIQILRAESKKYPERLDLHQAIADMSARAHDYSSAISEYQAILAKLDPKTTLASQIQGSLGEAYRSAGQYEPALSALNKAREGLPKDAAILSNLAVTLLHLGRNADARQLYESTFRLQQDNPIALNNLAFLIAEKNGDLDSALTFAQRARQKWPHIHEISDTLAWIYLKKNLNDNAIEILANIVTERPNQPTFRYHLGAAWLQKGDKPKARREFEAALANRPSAEETGKIKELLAKAST